LLAYYDLANKALEEAPADQKLTWSHIKSHTLDVYQKLSQMKFQEPKDGAQKVIEDWMKQHNIDIESAFKSLNENLL